MDKGETRTSIWVGVIREDEVMQGKIKSIVLKSEKGMKPKNNDSPQG